MSFWPVFGLMLATFGLSLLLTGLLRRHALHTQLMDVPNQRSSHSRPTPQGGGLAVVISFSAGLGITWLWGQLPSSWLLAMGLGGGLIAAIGYLDDRHNLPARWRFPVHVLAALWALWCLGSLLALSTPWGMIEPGWLGWVLAVIAVVWLLNLYNFMDGIDGIAGIEAITVALGAALLLWWHGDDQAAVTMGLLAAASLGFLLWNWPPAKIFMGDAGSAYLGFVLAVAALATSTQGPLNLWVWLILLAVFIVDASFTLLRRLLRGDRWYEAHRSHAYQHAALRLDSHKLVTLTVGTINLLWLLPLAWAAMHWPHWGAALTVLAWLPLLVLALRLGAGTHQDAQ